MDIFWYALTGLLLVGYLTLESMDFGVGMLFFFGRSDAERERLRRTVVPLFLANEVWLIAFAGLLFGALPLLEEGLVSGLRSPVVVLVCLWCLRDAGLWFRPALPGTGWRRAWDVVIPVSSLLLAAGWGAVLAVLVRGLSSTGDGVATATAGDLLHPYALASAAVFVVASLRQGLFLTVRNAPGGVPPVARTDQFGRRLTWTLLGLILVTAVLGLVFAGSPVAVAINALLPAVAVLGSGRDHGAGRSTRALVRGTAPLIALPVTVAVAHGTTVLATRSGDGGLALGDVIADSSTLGLLAAIVLPVLVAVGFAQVWMWRVFGRAADRADLSDREPRPAV
ncbi:cytochrome d ubiquinol oxidase subunit II [Streptomyces sp. 150FB]|uniref:cytochrome d ubiquinol oxidase subunit II n=1 Tax=Streptomyces sp. 150FB TaxID=1576605 RepID=UPI000589472E|nr:cytochrome d ubiquinol oxidase subunit II [Streptomyces sp. 150FB]